MNRCLVIATLCTGRPDRLVYLDGVRDGVRLCGPCVDAAARLGMNPVPDRRRVPRTAAA